MTIEVMWSGTRRGLPKIEASDIQKLAGEAWLAGDDEQASLCDRALAGDRDAWAECERVIQSWRAERGA